MVLFFPSDILIVWIDVYIYDSVFPEHFFE